MSPSPRVVKQAIQWMLRLRENGTSPALHAQCEQWRAADQQHELAWQRLHTLQQELNLRAVPGAGVALHTLEASSQRLHRRQALKLLGGVALVSSAGWLAKDLQLLDSWTSDYATATGERRSIRLPDGSLLQLNTHSAADLAFDAKQRLVHLKHGELMLTCAADSQGRPLLIRTRDTLVEGFDGRFVVRQHDNCTQVSVSQGSVAIHTAPGVALRWLRAGEAVQIDQRGITPIAQPNMDAGAWAEGLIVTRNMRLADFLAEVGRYRHGYVSYAGDIADLRLSGVYRLEDTDKLLQLLPQTLPVRVSYRTRWWVRLERMS
ncbi:FecR domain-containing protein [Pseudomonas fontis]|uniref:FecR family protein n=1 Tax=Pseudomonas fontis TaxID=2942633 RepID=A0ABT5NM49_9PSED|nr:FecR family protein [Pseudomonas fontis]MDD0977353.1 FecR family protein [Pseudomonas fontis]MDD0988930.1 FecR family protein [Pseudomonas fontis]